MRILIVNYRYFLSGGPERYMFNIMEALKKAGHEVIPFSIHSNKNVESEYSHYFVEPIGGRDATYFNEVKKTPKSIIQLISRSVYSPEVEKAVRKEIREVKPDLVYIIHIVNKLSPSVIVGAKKEHVPVVMRLSDYHLLCPSFHFLRNDQVCEECLQNGLHSCIRYRCVKGSFFASFIRVFAMRFHKLIKVYDKVDTFVSPSLFLKNKMSDNGFKNSRIEWIPTFYNPKEEYNSFELGDYGLYIGRVTKEKGVEYIIRAYENIPDHRLVIMGDDTTDEALRLKEYVTEHNMNNVSFIGFKSGQEFMDVVKKARFTIVSSIWYENLPNTVLESFYYYKPVIATNIGSLTEPIQDGHNGLVFPPADYKKLSNCILKMDDDKFVEACGKNARKTVDEKYSLNKHLNSLEKLFEDVIKNNDAE